MSSRSLAAARARRAGENAPPVSGNRPGTSIGSGAAFANQNYQQPTNIRTSRPGSGQQQQEPQQPQQQSQNKLGFNKLSISDAIGLITLRLGRVEQYIIETEHEKDINGDNNGNSGLDTTIFNNIINRIDSLEKKDGTPEDITKLVEQITRIGDETSKHTLAISKHTEQLFRFERELTETKDILKTFMLKYDNFAKETNDRFGDFEFALSEVEKNLPASTVSLEPSSTSQEETIDNIYENPALAAIDSNTIMSEELKNLIKQELSSNNTV